MVGKLPVGVLLELRRGLAFLSVACSAGGWQGGEHVLGYLLHGRMYPGEGIQPSARALVAASTRGPKVPGHTGIGLAGLGSISSPRTQWWRPCWVYPERAQAPRIIWMASAGPSNLPGRRRKRS